MADEQVNDLIKIKYYLTFDFNLSNNQQHKQLMNH